jgi:hypothetical protein
VRWFLGLADRQVSQSQPIAGTPTLVPHPVTINSGLTVSISRLMEQSARFPFRVKIAS